MNPIDHLNRLRQRHRTGDPFEADDLKWLFNAIDAAEENGKSFNHNLGLADNWGKASMHTQLMEAYVRLECHNDGGRFDEFFERHANKIEAYRKEFFEKNKQKGHRPRGITGLYHEILLANQGETPAGETMRKRARQSRDRFRDVIPEIHARKIA